VLWRLAYIETSQHLLDHQEQAVRARLCDQVLRLDQ
jgi:hypothetical protein